MRWSVRQPADPRPHPNAIRQAALVLKCQITLPPAETFLISSTFAAPPPYRSSAPEDWPPPPLNRIEEGAIEQSGVRIECRNPSRSWGKAARPRPLDHLQLINPLGLAC